MMTAGVCMCAFVLMEADKVVYKMMVTGTVHVYQWLISISCMRRVNNLLKEKKLVESIVLGWISCSL